MTGSTAGVGSSVSPLVVGSPDAKVCLLLRLEGDGRVNALCLVWENMVGTASGFSLTFPVFGLVLKKGASMCFYKANY